MEDILRGIQDANLCQPATKFEKRPAKGWQRHRQVEMRILAERRKASRLVEQGEECRAQGRNRQGEVAEHPLPSELPRWRNVLRDRFSEGEPFENGKNRLRG